MPAESVPPITRDEWILLHARMERLAVLLACEVSDLRLDHTWALENRPKVRITAVSAAMGSVKLKSHGTRYRNNFRNCRTSCN